MALSLSVNGHEDAEDGESIDLSRDGGGEGEREG